MAGVIRNLLYDLAVYRITISLNDMILDQRCPQPEKGALVVSSALLARGHCAGGVGPDSRYRLPAMEPRLPPLRWIAEEPPVYDAERNEFHRPGCAHRGGALRDRWLRTRPVAPGDWARSLYPACGPDAGSCSLGGAPTRHRVRFARPVCWDLAAAAVARQSQVQTRDRGPSRVRPARLVCPDLAVAAAARRLHVQSHAHVADRNREQGLAEALSRPALPKQPGRPVASERRAAPVGYA